LVERPSAFARLKIEKALPIRQPLLVVAVDAEEMGCTLLEFLCLVVCRKHPGTI
jgi:hypothetical protein